MFDLSERPTVWIPVEWTQLKPGENDGLAVESKVEIEILIELLDRDELIKLFGPDFGIDPEEGDEPTEKKSKFEQQVDRFMAVVSDWRKFKNKGENVTFGRDMAEKILKVPGFAPAFVTAYLSACGGKADIRKGN